ncbi:MAG: ATP citrate synthase [Candidatus Heimdallarchaeota archaeon]|nr:MAG: ATP citrate synthase [Candidatus Heimdallarchaeota archaeon]
MTVELFNRNTKAIIYGFQRNAIQRMLDFDFVCKRETPSVAAVIRPSQAGAIGYHKVFWGGKEIVIPIYRKLALAIKKHPDADVLINFSSFRSAYPTTMEALNADTIKTVAVIAEGIPERQSREMHKLAQSKGKVIIGPATVGGIQAGAFKIGNTAGTIENVVLSKLYRPGSVGFVSKSGGMSNEMNFAISQNSDGVYEGIAIGGDRYAGSTLLDHLLRYEANPKIKMMVCLGEVGGTGEIDIVNAVKDGRITKPLVMWCIGTAASILPSGLQFGHAGAMAGSEMETASAKNKALAEVGVIVPDSYDDFGDKIKETFEKLKAEGKIDPIDEFEPPKLPMDYAQASRQGIVRRPTDVVCTISDERGDVPMFAGVGLDRIIRENKSIGYTIGLLWFKRELPQYAQDYIEMVVKLTADHGPAVSGAHNAIITARAGRDLMSSLSSGILTIGPRFGGAISDAAKYIKEAVDKGSKPVDFVDYMKNVVGINIPGIGHRIKSVQNPDVRVTLLKEFVFKHFETHPHLDFSLEVEKITTAKRNNLILNVDGCIGICFLDLLLNLGLTDDEIQDVIDSELLNGLFVLGRSIGMMGHIFDQKRQRAALYRQPWDEILFSTEN